MYHVEISTLARLEIADAYDWYGKQKAGLGAQLLDEFQVVCAKLRENPLMFSQIAGGARRARMKRFPYGVFFVLDADRVVVTAFFHLKRDPRHLVDRTE